LKPVRIIGLAEQELREATDWYRDRDPRVAERFVDEARQALQLIERFPQIGGRVPGIDDGLVRSMPIQKFPYHVVFVDVGARLEVVAFAHNRRRPLYFLARIRR
jgi:plasmid stabilization system protein ParE